MEGIAKAIFNKPYRVIENQKKFQELPGPVFLKTATDRMVFRGAITLAAVGLVGISYSIYRLSSGTGKIQRF